VTSDMRHQEHLLTVGDTTRYLTRALKR